MKHLNSIFKGQWVYDDTQINKNRKKKKTRIERTNLSPMEVAIASNPYP